MALNGSEVTHFDAQIAGLSAFAALRAVKLCLLWQRQQGLPANAVPNAPLPTSSNRLNDEGRKKNHSLFNDDGSCLCLCRFSFLFIIIFPSDTNLHHTRPIPRANSHHIIHQRFVCKHFITTQRHALSTNLSSYARRRGQPTTDSTPRVKQGS